LWAGWQLAFTLRFGSYWVNDQLAKYWNVLAIHAAVFVIAGILFRDVRSAPAVRELVELRKLAAVTCSPAWRSC